MFVKYTHMLIHFNQITGGYFVIYAKIVEIN